MYDYVYLKDCNMAVGYKIYIIISVYINVGMIVYISGQDALKAIYIYTYKQIYMYIYIHIYIGMIAYILGQDAQKVKKIIFSHFYQMTVTTYVCIYMDIFIRISVYI
jgi:hypothetical protein